MNIESCFLELMITDIIKKMMIIQPYWTIHNYIYRHHITRTKTYQDRRQNAAAIFAREKHTLGGKAQAGHTQDQHDQLSNAKHC